MDTSKKDFAADVSTKIDIVSIGSYARSHLDIAVRKSVSPSPSQSDTLIFAHVCPSVVAISGDDCARSAIGDAYLWMGVENSVILDYRSCSCKKEGKESGRLAKRRGLRDAPIDANDLGRLVRRLRVQSPSAPPGGKPDE
uniref:Uncharacterized protein n=1 Tax=Panagrellus redivivus TaxID=6233 RepID=A0A7E4ULA3_PANRE